MLAAALALTLASPPAIVLTYHDVIARRDKNSVWFDCTAKELEDQILWLKKQGAKFVSVATLSQHLTRNQFFSGKTVCVTFADNYEGFRLRGWPILQKHKVPVTMFVHTGFVGNQTNRPKMSWTELAELQKNPLFTVGSQTISHPADLTTVTDSQLKREMVGSKESIRTHLDRVVEFVAYPNGKFDARVARAAKQAGYTLGFTEVQTPVTLKSQPFMVPRYVHTKYKQAWKDAFGS